MKKDLLDKMHRFVRKLVLIRTDVRKNSDKPAGSTEMKGRGVAMTNYAPASKIATSTSRTTSLTTSHATSRMMSRPVAPVSRSAKQYTGKLNARGRRFVRRATMFIVALVAAIGFFSGQAAIAGSESVKANFTYVTIHSGESLWQLAAKLAPNTDRRDWIASVVDLNALTSADVVPGQRIALPQ
jgi:hypothetical protein